MAAVLAKYAFEQECRRSGWPRPGSRWPWPPWPVPGLAAPRAAAAAAGDLAGPGRVRGVCGRGQPHLLRGHRPPAGRGRGGAAVHRPGDAARLQHVVPAWPRRRAGAAGVAAAAVSLAGAVLVSRALEGLGGLDLPGLAAGLASAVLFAAYLLSAELAGRRGAEPATTLLWGFVVAVAIWSVAVPWWSWPVGTWPTRVWPGPCSGSGCWAPCCRSPWPWGRCGWSAPPPPGSRRPPSRCSRPPSLAAAGPAPHPAQLAGAALVVAGVVLAQLAAARVGGRGGGGPRRLGGGRDDEPPGPREPTVSEEREEVTAGGVLDQLPDPTRRDQQWLDSLNDVVEREEPGRRASCSARSSAT